MLTKQDILHFLEDCGIQKHDTVTVHCSLRAIGPIEGGADGLIDAFCEYLSEGLFLVPTHTWANVGRSSPFYDLKSTVPCIGTLAKVAAFRQDAVRSLHPTHSMAGFGARAADYLRGEECSSTPAPVGGSLSRLYEERGKILLIGVGHERNTYLHAVEERLCIPNRLHPDPFTVTVRDSDGGLHTIPSFRPHFTAGIDCGISEFYQKFKEAFEVSGAVTYATLGKALVYCCDAVGLSDTLSTLWKDADRDLCLSPDTPRFPILKANEERK